MNIQTDFRIRLGVGSCAKIRRVKIVLTGDSNQGEQGVASRISERCSHAARHRRLGYGAHWPFRRQPLSGRMGERRGKSDQPRLFVDRGGLHRRDFVAAERLARDI